MDLNPPPTSPCNLESASVTNKAPSVTRIYVPPDANTLLCIADACLRSTDCINVIVADKQKHLQFTAMDEAIVHCAKGFGIWERASTDKDQEPDVVEGERGLHGLYQ